MGALDALYGYGCQLLLGNWGVTVSFSSVGESICTHPGKCGPERDSLWSDIKNNGGILVGSVQLNTRDDHQDPQPIILAHLS